MSARELESDEHSGALAQLDLPQPNLSRSETLPAILPLEPRDAEQAAALDACCMAHPWSQASWLAEIERASCRGLFLERSAAGLVALIAWRQVLDEAEITRLLVHPAHRRAGHARRLVAQVTCRGTCFLEVRARNQAARAFYQASGFVEVGRRPGYYHTPVVDDAIVLARKVSG